MHYGFTFTEDGTRAHCREAYTSAANVLQHLGDVDGPLKAVSEVVYKVQHCTSALLSALILSCSGEAINYDPVC